MSKINHPMSDYEVEIYNEGHQDGSVSGAKRERERILDLLDEQVCTDNFCVHDSCVNTLVIIELLQEESK